ncbi:MYXO-CTERM sorting domain-containing protein [Myxococcota bacterium]|nr:MYXO-CTERM sorting domain-containing protein [Myxococcota bacterium]
MLLFALLPAALAYESDTHTLLYDDLLAVFDPVEYDSGWVPSGSPVAVAFRINAEGGAYTQMDGETGLTWPTALTQNFVAYEEGGLFALDASIVASVDMKIDLWGIYWEDALAEAGDSFYGEAVFTPWLLPGGELEAVEAAAEGTDRELFNLEYDIFSGVGIYLNGALRPDARASLRGVRFSAGDGVAEEDGATILHEIPDTSSLNLYTTLTTAFTAGLDLVIVPTFGVCASVFGCYDVASFDIPVSLIDAEGEHDLPSALTTFPLPRLTIAETTHSFGEVEIGQIATWELALGNEGDQVLEGIVGTYGPGEFTVFPGQIYIAPGGMDGVVITFAPTVEGVQEIELVLVSSDPSQPELRLTVSGAGVAPPMPVISAEVGTCGCAASDPESLGTVGLLAALGALLARRRRAP